MRLGTGKLLASAIMTCGWLMLSGSVFSQSISWQKFNGPNGCYVADMVVDSLDPSRVFMAIDFDGVYMSTDSGLSWTSHNSGIGAGATAGWVIDMDYETPQHMYYGCFFDGLYTDSTGSNWTKSTFVSQNGCDHVQDIAIDRSNPGTVYIVTDDVCLYKSTDYGGTWVKKDSLHQNHTGLAVSRSNSNVVFASADDFGSETYTIIKSTDGGDSWSDASAGIDTSQFILSLAIHPSDENRVIAGTESGFYHTTDGGNSWTGQSSGLSTPYCRDVAYDPDNPNRWLVATWDGLYRKLDTSSQWQDLSVSFTNRMVKSIDFDPTNASVMLASVWGGSVQERRWRQRLDVSRCWFASGFRCPPEWNRL